MTTPPVRKALGPTPRPSAGDRLRAIPRGLTTIPVTLLTVGLLLLAGILTGTLFTPADPTDSAITSLEFGLPAFRDGRIWTLFTGAVTFTEPEFYLFVGLLLAAGLGLYERRVGSLRAAFALVVTHSVGIVVPALLLWPFADGNWTWGSTLAGELDAGLSAGGFGVAAAATALIGPPWRGRLRVLVTTFLTVLLLKSGLLWDLEHFTAWIAGLALGPWLARATLLERRRAAAEVTVQTAGEVAAQTAGDQPEPDPQRSDRFPRPAEARILAALIAAGFSVSNVVASLYPGLGGIIGPGVGAAEVRGFWLIMLELVISLLICGALPRPRALGWWIAVLGVTAIIVNSLANTPMVSRIGDAVCATIVLAVLLWNHRAWPWRTDRTALRPIGVLIVITIVFIAVTSVAIWAVREQFQPIPDLFQVVRAASSRLTFTVGPVAPRGNGARGVIVMTGIIWAVTLTGWLIWALYLLPLYLLPSGRAGRSRQRSG